MERCPLSVAIMRGVLPSLSLESMRAPFSNALWTFLRSPSQQARMRGVHPLASLVSTFSFGFLKGRICLMVDGDCPIPLPPPPPICVPASMARSVACWCSRNGQKEMVCGVLLGSMCVVCVDVMWRVKRKNENVFLFSSLIILHPSSPVIRLNGIRGMKDHHHHHHLVSIPLPFSDHPSSLILCDQTQRIRGRERQTNPPENDHPSCDLLLLSSHPLNKHQTSIHPSIPS